MCPFFAAEAWLKRCDEAKADDDHDDMLSIVACFTLHIVLTTIIQSKELLGSKDSMKDE